MRSDLVEIIVGLEQKGCSFKNTFKTEFFSFKKGGNEKLTSCRISSSFGITQSSRYSPLLGDENRIKVGKMHQLARVIHADIYSN